MIARRIAAAALALAAAFPAAAQTALDYQDALRTTLSVQGCGFEAGDAGTELSFARELSRYLGIPAMALLDRRGPEQTYLRAALEQLASRGLVAVDGARITLVDCR